MSSLSGTFWTTEDSCESREHYSRGDLRVFDSTTGRDVTRMFIRKGHYDITPSGKELKRVMRKIEDMMKKGGEAR